MFDVVAGDAKHFREPSISVLTSHPISTSGREIVTLNVSLAWVEGRNTITSPVRFPDTV
jgi:hypothetical protein